MLEASRLYSLHLSGWRERKHRLFNQFLPKQRRQLRSDACQSSRIGHVVFFPAHHVLSDYELKRMNPEERKRPGTSNLTILPNLDTCSLHRPSSISLATSSSVMAPGVLASKIDEAST